MSADFIGISCLDQLYYVDQFPVENGKIRSSESFNQSGGFATNAAKAYACLGGKATLHTKIGQTGMAQIVHDDLNTHGVHVVDYDQDDHNLASSTIIINTSSGSRTIVSSAKTPEIDTSLCDDDLNLKGNVVFIDGFYIQSAMSAVQNAKSRGAITVFDADKWRDERYMEFLSDIDYVIAGSEFYPPDCRSQQDVIDFLLGLGVKYFAITNGADDIYYHDDGVTGMINVPQIKCVDSLAAGDVFHGAFCCYIEKDGFVEALKQSAEIASKFCRDYGFRALLPS